MNFPPASAFRTSRIALWIGLAVGALALAPQAHAITVKIDYSYDANHFFSDGNPAGAAAGPIAKATLEAAATYFSNILSDTFSAIQLPNTYQGTGGSVTWHWSLTFPDPAAASGDVTVQDAFIPANEFRIYVGAKTFADHTLALGGYGAAFVPGVVIPGTFNFSERAAVLQIDGNFKNAALKRGEDSGDFGAWGGAISFNRSPASPWNLGLALPDDETNDFLSVALHEMAHALGFGTSQEWINLASGSAFAGQAAKIANGNVAPLLQAPTAENPNRSHWLSSTMSTVYGTNISQETLMDPELNTGSRKRFTRLDAAGLTDIGWTLTPPAVNPADFNLDGVVDNLDFNSWKTAFGPTGGASADGDNDTDGADFLYWQRARGAAPYPAAANVPEPATLGLVAWLTLLTGRRRSPSLEGRG